MEEAHPEGHITSEGDKADGEPALNGPKAPAGEGGDAGTTEEEQEKIRLEAVRLEAIKKVKDTNKSKCLEV